MKKNSIQFEQVLGNEVADKRIDILRRIGEVGSISEAARGAGVSYKAAWQAIETLTNLSGAVLVEKNVGGSGGGGARLTPTGIRLLQASALLSAAKNSVIATLNRASQPGDSISGLVALSLRTSMRNQLPCKIKAFEKKNASVRIELELADGSSLFSKITRESSQLLGLHPGQNVLALCKATAVCVAQHLEYQDGFNLLHGKVSRASASKSDSEIGLHLPSGLQLVGFAHSGHGLRKQDSAMASIDESGVVIAITG